MPDIIIYPNGKPVRVKWFDQDPPTEDDIDEMYDNYAKSRQPVNTGRVGPPTNRVPSGFNRQIDVSGSFAPVVPGTTPGVAIPSGDPNQRHEIKPTVAAQATNPLDFAVGVAQKYNQPQPYTGPPATPQNNLILGGLQQQASAAQKAKQLQKGPSVHDVRKQIEQNQVKAAYNKQKATQAWASQQIINNAIVRQQAEVAAGNPNYVGSEQAAQDFYTNQGQLPTAEQIASQKAAQARNLAHDPLRQLQAGPAGLFGAAANALPHAAIEASSGMNEDVAKNLKPVEDLASYLVPVIGDAKFAGDMAKSLSSGDYQGLAQNAALVLGAHFGIPLLSKAKNALADLSKVGDYTKFDESLGQLGLEPNARAAIVQQIKANPLAKLKGFDANGKPIVRVKAQGLETEPSLTSQPSPKSAIWRSQDTDIPIELTGREETHTDGKTYAQTTQGSWVPKDEIVGETNASKNTENATLHGNVQPQPGEGKAEVSTAQGGQGIQPEASPGIQAPEAKQAQEVAAPKATEPPPEPTNQFRHEDTAAIRQKLGLPEYQGGGTNWDNAIKKAFSEGHVERADSLVEDINNGNRHVFKPEERAGVAIKGQALSDHLDTIGQQMDAAKAAGDQAGYDALRGEYNDVKGRINDYLDALDKSGSGAGDALQSSKIKFGKQTDPVRIERDFEAAAGRKPNEQESADLEKLRQEVIKAQKAQADAEAGRQVAEQARAEAEARANFAQEQRQARQATRRTKSETIDAQIDELGKKWREKITQTSANPFLDPEAYKIIAQTANLYIKKGLLKFEDVVDAVKTHLEGVTDRHIIDALSGNYPREPKTNRELLTEKQKLQADLAENKGNIKIQAKIYDIEHQIRTGEIKTKNARVSNPVSVERQKLQANLGKANQRLRYYIESKKKIGPVELLSRVQRFSILSGPSVFGKLGVATASHSLITPIEDLIGVGAGKLSGLKGVEASASLRGDVAAVKEFFKKETWRDVWSKATGKGNTLSNAYGTEKFKGGPIWEFFGNLHGAVKTPLQRAAFQKEAIKMTDFLASKGVDVTKPEVLTSITAHAYQKSLEAILMNDSKATRQARQIIEKLPLGKTIAPIVRVPINFAGRTGEYIAGLPYGAGKQILAKISKTPLDEAAQNAILRAYKRGSVGAALGVVGFYHPDLTDNLPSWAKHTPVVETLALGGALRKGWEEADHTKKGATSDTFTHLGSAIYRAGNEYAQNIPGVETMSKVIGGIGSSDAQAEGRFGKAAADYITSFFVPQLIQQVGKYFDPEAVKKGENYYKTQGFREEIAKNTPGLRQTLADVPVPKDDWWAKSDSKEFKETQGLDLKFSAPDWIKDKTKANYDVTSQQYNQRYRAISAAIQKSVRETLADPGYNRMSTEDKARVLKRIVESARKEANAQVNASRH